MGKQKTLKARGRAAFLRNKWAAIAVCFILAFTGVEFTHSVDFIHEFSAENQTMSAIANDTFSKTSNWDYMMQWLDAPDNHPLIEAAGSTAGPFFNTITAPFSSFFAFLGRSSINGMTGLALAIIGVLGGLWFKLFVVRTLLVGSRRFFLENRNADGISIGAMFYPFKRKNWWPVVKAMLLRSIYNLLWFFTIIGGIIKMYSYRMVPYIMAENPQTKARDAINLSRKMMKGNKWKTFLLDAVLYLQWTFVPTMLAGLIFNLIGSFSGMSQLFTNIAIVAVAMVSIFFANGYKAATFTELYADLRQAQIEKEEPLAKCFTVSEFNENSPVLTKEQALANPVFHVHEKLKIDYNYKYHIRTLILLFFAFSMVGWLWEVTLHVVTKGMFVNRGTMLGPWLPIYGAGGVVVLILLKKLFKNPVATFFVSMVICSIIEYFTSWYLEVSKGIRWWDYSGYFMNLNGRICLEGAVVFGLGCCAVVYFAAPLLAKFFDKYKASTQIVLCVILVSLFGADSIYSKKHPNIGKGITDYDSKKAEFIIPNYKALVSLSPTDKFHL